VRSASSVLSASNQIPFNKPFAEASLEALRTQAVRKTLTDTPSDFAH
jgi:hypothetical protein